MPIEATLTTAAATTSRVQLRLRLVSPTAADPGLAAVEALCDQVGVPCERLIAATTPLTPELLVAANGEARYQGVFLTNNELAYSSGGAYVTAFDADEWNTLWQFERDYGVRQVSLYSFPGSYPEPLGISYAGVAPSTTAAPYYVTLTAAGREVFSTLKADVSVPVRHAYGYQARLDGSVPAQPLLQDAAGNVLAVTTTSADGRERLALTVAHSPSLLHTQLLGYDLLRWITRGVFIGQRHFYLNIDQDDWFAPTDKWDAAVGGVRGEYRLSAKDVVSVVEQQQKLRRSYPFAKGFTWTLAFNGAYANPKAKRGCSVNTQGIDPLTSLTLCYKNEFFWVNHTFSHAYMDAPTSYTEALAEITDNTKLARQLGLAATKGYAERSLVTGDISGLGWYAPGGPDSRPKVDYGLSASNPEFLRAAQRAGVRYVAANMSVRSHEPDAGVAALPTRLTPASFWCPAGRPAFSPRRPPPRT